MDASRERPATNAAVGKLDARTISIDEAQQLLDNRYVIAPTRAAVEVARGGSRVAR